MIIALNNKSNLDKYEFLDYQERINRIDSKEQIIVCPTFLNIGNYTIRKFSLGAQNVSSTEEGAHTGEVSAKALKSFGVDYCIVGHSERRQNQKESNNEINKKIKQLMAQDIIPILCIGETQEERENNHYKEIIEEEIKTAILSVPNYDTIIIAYEPIWSIGTGVIPTNEQIEEVFSLIKSILPNNKILYGGSANEKNIDQLKKIKNNDGFLLGGLSLKPAELSIFLNKLI